MSLRLIVELKLVRAKSRNAGPAAEHASRAVACPSTFRKSGSIHASRTWRGRAPRRYWQPMSARRPRPADKFRCRSSGPTRNVWPLMSISESSAASIRSASASACARLGAGRRDDGKFVTAQPGEEGALACRLQPARHLAEQSVADIMPEHVVDGLEAVEIHGQKREVITGDRREPDCRDDAIVEGGRDLAIP